MSRIRVTHDIDDLANDLAAIVRAAPGDMARVVRKNAVDGNKLAAGFAKESAGRHGKHYHRAFSAEQVTPLSYEYGPDSAKPQGGMSFERGSRNQPPHLDLAKSADLIGPAFAQDVHELPDSWFWGAGR